MNNLRIGVPSKGRLAEIAAELLKEAGLSFRRQERSLFARCREVPVDITFLRTEDIPVLCAEGAIDMGITGGDLLAESGVQLANRLDLGVGECRLAVCVPEDSAITTPAQLDGCRVATSFPHVTEEFLRKHHAQAHTGESVGLGRDHDRAGRGRRDCRPGRNRQHAGGQSLAHSGRDRPLSDRARAKSGGSRRPNWPTAWCGGSKAWSSPAATRCWSTTCRARNCRQPKRSRPGFNSPTVSALEDADWCAVRVMVRRTDVIGIMEKLEALGASAILETRNHELPAVMAERDAACPGAGC